MKNQFDINDFKYVSEKIGVPVAFNPCPVDPRTGKINPQASQFQILGKHEQTVSVFHVKPIYYEHISSTDENLVFRPMYEVCEHYGNRKVVFKYEKMLEIHPRYIEWLRKRMTIINGDLLVTSPFSEKISRFNYAHELVHSSVVKPKIGMTVTTVYPDPHPETSTIDGYMLANNYSTWAGAHDAATSSSSDDTGGVGLLISGCRRQTSSDFDIWRAVATFDTSAVGADTVSAVTLSLHYNTASANWDTQNGDIDIVGVTLATPTELVVGDYDGFDATVQASVDITSLSSTAYYDFTCTTSFVNKTGVTEYGIRESHDVDDTSPTLNAVGSRARWDGADTAGTGSDPKLAVTHTGGGGGGQNSNFLALMM